MSEPTLSIRSTESKEYGQSETPPVLGRGQAAYAVALISTPPFPGENHVRSLRLSVICAARYVTQTQPENLYGWIHLTPDTKEEIGNDLVALGAQPGQWWWLILSTPVHPKV